MKHSLLQAHVVVRTLKVKNFTSSRGKLHQWACRTCTTSLFRKLPRVRAVSCYNYDQQAQVHICASPLCVFPHTYHHLCVSLVGKHKILSPQTATMKELYGPEETYFISHLFPYSYVFRIGLKMMYVVLSICRLRQHCSFV